MTKYLNSQIFQSWNTLLQTIELARNYPLSTPMMIGPISRNPIIDYILPSLLFINAVSILDEALAFYISEQNYSNLKNYRNNLNDRINFLSERNLLNNPEDLHSVRLKRNRIAHSYETDIWDSVSWQDLNDTLNTIETELQNLGFVGDRPKFEFFAEKSTRASTEQDIITLQDFCFGLKQNNKRIIELSTTFEIRKTK